MTGEEETVSHNDATLGGTRGSVHQDSEKRNMCWRVGKGEEGEGGLGCLQGLLGLWILGHSDSRGARLEDASFLRGYLLQAAAVGVSQGRQHAPFPCSSLHRLTGRVANSRNLRAQK